MTTRQYIGARYIPIFADPVEWSNERAYEHLMMVQHQGETYLSQQAVPIGIDLPDTSQGEESNDYWVHMSNWNAQVETYRQEVLQYNGRISTIENDLPISAFDSTNTVDARFDEIESNNWVTTDRINNEAITTAKIADSNVTTAKIADSNVTTAKIADSNVTTAKIADSNVTTAKIADSNVTTAKIADSNITLEKLAAKSVDSTKLTNYVGANMLFIGDSYSDSTLDWGFWVGELAQNLHCTIDNRAINGSGFIASDPTTTFDTQLTNAYNDNNEYSDIIIYGGNNDVTHLLNNYDALCNAISTFFIHCNQYWPNAKIHCFIGNFPRNRIDVPSTFRITCQNRARKEHIKNIVFYPYVNAWQISRFGFRSDTNAHPSDAFAKALVEFFTNALMGQAAEGGSVVGVTFEANTTTTDVFYIQTGNDYFSVPPCILSCTNVADAGKIATIAASQPLGDSTGTTGIGNYYKRMYHMAFGNAGGTWVPVMLQFDFVNRQILLYSGTTFTGSIFVPAGSFKIPW